MPPPKPPVRPSFDQLLARILAGQDTIDHDDLAIACAMHTTEDPTHEEDTRSTKKKVR